MYIFVGVLGIAIAGCRGGKQTVMEDFMGGIKIGDLRTPDGTDLPPEVHLTILTFEMPAESFILIESIYERIRKEPLRFVNYDSFTANGFSVGYGKNEMWNKIAARLELVKAKKTMTSNLMVFDKTGNELPVTIIRDEQTVFYTRADDTVTGVSLIDGDVVLGVKAEPIADIQGLANVKIEPMFKSNLENMFSKIAGMDKDENIFFESASFQLRMGEGDFVLIGPKKYTPDEMNLGNLFFVTHGDFLIPEPNEEKIGDVTIKSSFTMKKNIPLIRLYLVVCTRVQN